MADLPEIPDNQLDVDNPIFATPNGSGGELDENVQVLSLQSLDYHVKRLCEVQHNTARTMGQMIVENISFKDELKVIKEYTQDMSHSLNKRMEALVTITTEKIDALGSENARSVREIQQQNREILVRIEESTARSTPNSVGPEPPLNSTIRKNNNQVSSYEGLNGTQNVTNASQLGDNRVLKCVSPELFRGKKQSIRDYLTHFNMYAELSNWDDFNRQRVLLLSVKDDAADYLYSIDKYEEKSYEELCNLLIERFEEIRLISAEKLKLSQRKKEKGESWYQLVQDLEKMCAIVYKGGPTSWRGKRRQHSYKICQKL